MKVIGKIIIFFESICIGFLLFIDIKNIIEMRTSYPVHIMWNYFSKLWKSFLIYHSKIFISPIHGWMTTFLSFLLPMGKCITLMGTQNNIVYSNAPYITLIIGKWSLAHTVEPKKLFHLSKKNTRNNMDGLYDWIRGIILLYL